MLGKVFDSLVPVRKPRNRKHKTLTEVAIKERSGERSREKSVIIHRTRKREKPSSPKMYRHLMTDCGKISIIVGQIQGLLLRDTKVIGER